MESIAEVVIVSVKRQCSSCNVLKDDDQFVNALAIVPSSRPVNCVEMLRRSIGIRLRPQK